MRNENYDYNNENTDLGGNDLNNDVNNFNNSSLDPEHVRSLRFHCDTITAINFSPNQ
jgi:hypothetical protein